MRLILGVALSAALTTSSVMGTTNTANAQTFHQYSRVGMNAYSYAQTGLSVLHQDANVQVSSGDCGTNGDPTLGVPVIYQTQWVLTTASYSNWLEIGTGHRGTCHFHFWGYGENGQWHPYGWEYLGSLPQGPWDFIIRRLYGNWEFDISGRNVWNLDSAASTWAGVAVETGYESWDATPISVPPDYYYNLQYTHDEGGWLDWIDTTYSYENVDPAMCGDWVTRPTNFHGGQGTC